MSTDLNTVKDHPATLLRDFYAPQHATPGVVQAYQTAATALTGYEQVNNVTFAALDNDTLAAVRGSYAQAQEAPVGSHIYTEALRDLYRAVGDLLGLDD
jgi:hypothetical protein